jgi:hypothetical protein
MRTALALRCCRSALQYFDLKRVSRDAVKAPTGTAVLREAGVARRAAKTVTGSGTAFNLQCEQAGIEQHA